MTLKQEHPPLEVRVRVLEKAMAHFKINGRVQPIYVEGRLDRIEVTFSQKGHNKALTIAQMG